MAFLPQKIFHAKRVAAQAIAPPTTVLWDAIELNNGYTYTPGTGVLFLPGNGFRYKHTVTISASSMPDAGAGSSFAIFNDDAGVQISSSQVTFPISYTAIGGINGSPALVFVQQVDADPGTNVRVTMGGSSATIPNNNFAGANYCGWLVELIVQ